MEKRVGQRDDLLMFRVPSASKFRPATVTLLAPEQCGVLNRSCPMNRLKYRLT